MRRPDTARLQLELRRAAGPAGLYLLLIVAGLTAGGIILKNQTFQKPWERYYTARAQFADAKGVVPGTQQVRIAGVKVGVIKKSALVDGRAVLTLSIQAKYGRLYRDARLRLRPSTPLQDMYVAIERRGTKRAGELGDQILPAQQTTSPADIARVLDTFDDQTRQRLGVLLEGLGAGLEDRGAALRAAFEEATPFLKVAQRASGVVVRRGQTTRRLISNLGRLTDTLAERGDTLTSLVHHGEQSLGKLAEHDVDLGATLRELPGTVRAVQSSLSSVRAAEAELDPALRALGPVAEELRSGLQALETFGREAQPALAALRSPVRSLTPLARDLRPAASSLRSTAASFAKQAPAFDRITALLPPCLNRISAFFANTISVMKLADAGGTIPRAESTVSMDTLSAYAGVPVSEPSFKKQPTCTPGGQRP
ncbi:MAG: Mammalian cell entry related domain protein [Conexibacter sp.]|nr:Mammalian cell entry related domain protein [Conexibacter sp.]